MKHLTTIASVTLSLLVAAPAVANETYPSRPITWVVPFGAGGVTDSTGRMMAKAMSQIIGQPVLVDNRPGAAGIVGTEYVAAAKPDGYTILYASSGPMAVNPTLYKGKLSYDPLKSFTPVQALSQSNICLLYTSPSPRD